MSVRFGAPLSVLSMLNLTLKERYGTKPMRREGPVARDRVLRMSAGEIAGLVAAIAFVLLVGLVAVPLLKLGKVLDETTSLIRGVSNETVPLLNEVTTTVTTTNSQLVRVDAITSSAQTAVTNVSALTGVFAATLGSPVIKVAAFSYGVRKALASRGRADVERRVRNEMKAERRARRNRAA
jgi:uncharacterized protein YoxC